MRPPAVADPGPKSTSQQHVERGRDPRLRLQLRRDRLAQHLRRQGLRPRAPSRGRGRRGGEPSELIKLRLLQQLVDRGVAVGKHGGAVAEPVEDDAEVLGVAVDEEAALKRFRC